MNKHVSRPVAAIVLNEELVTLDEVQEHIVEVPASEVIQVVRQKPQPLVSHNRSVAVPH